MNMTATKTILLALMRRKETQRTVREWKETEPDLSARILKYAVCLEEDFREKFEIKDRSKHDWETCLFSDLMVLVTEQVNWQYIARFLLRRYAARGRRGRRGRKRGKWKRR